MGWKVVRTILTVIIILIILYLLFLAFQPEQTTQDSSSLTVTNNPEYSAYFCPEDDCASLVWQEFYKAKKIDCSVYSINLDWVWDFAKTKDLRIVTDDDQLKNKDIENVKTDNSSDYMHNKFCIFDENTLLIGSANFTQDSFEKQNNNIILTTDKTLVNAVNKQFEEYWKTNFNTPTVPQNNNYPKACFSPNNCISFYLQEIENAKQSVKCMFFSFTYNELGKALVEKQKEKVNVEIIMEKSQNSQYSEYDFLLDNNVNVIWDKNPTFMHNKFCVIDSNTVITGSMNPSNNGNFNNNESIIILQDKEIAQKYENYFDKYFALWQGE